MSKKQNREGMEIDLRRVLFALWSKAWLILLIGIVVGALAFGYAKFLITPTYTSSIQVYVNNDYADGGPGISSSQIDAAQNLAYTYMVILESRNVLDDVAKQSGLDYTSNQIRNMIYSKALNGTEVFEVAVTCEDYKHAAIIANTIADVLPEKIAAVVEGSSVRIVDYAVENRNPVAPNTRNYLLIGIAAGALLAIATVIVGDILDTTITNHEYLSHTYGKVPLLAVIPGSENPKGSYYRGYRKGYYESEEKRRARKSGGGV